MPATAHVRFGANGTALVQVGTQDIGTGTYTVMSQIAAETLGLPVERVRVRTGRQRRSRKRRSRAVRRRWRASAPRCWRRARRCGTSCSILPRGEHAGLGRTRMMPRCDCRTARSSGPDGRASDRGVAGAQRMEFIEADAAPSRVTSKAAILDALIRRAVRRGAFRSGYRRVAGQPFRRCVRRRARDEREDRAQPADRRHRLRPRHGAARGDPGGWRDGAHRQCQHRRSTWCR